MEMAPVDPAPQRPDRDQDAEAADAEALRALAVLAAGASFAVFDAGMRLQQMHGPEFARFGYQPGQAIGRSAGEILPQASWQQLRPLYAATLGGLSQTVTYTTLDGRVDYELAFEPVRAQGRVIGGAVVVRDVTALRAHAGGVLEESAAQFETSFAHAPVGMCLVGLDGRMLRVNPSACKLFQRTEADLLAGDFQRLTHPDDLQADLDLLAETVAGRRSGYELEKRYLTPWGQVIETRLSVTLVRDVAGRPSYFVSQIVDLTALNGARRELAEAYSMLEAVFQSAPIGKFVSRRHADGSTEIVQCNPAFAAMLGYRPEEIIGRSGRDLVVEEDLPRRAELIADIVAGQTATVEARWRHRNGRPIWTLTSGAPATTMEHGSVYVLQTVDISERKRLEARLRHVADHDPLTGLLTRRALSLALDAELSRTAQGQPAGALMVIDLDGFKRVNDEHGHAAGDRLLRHVAHTMRARLRTTDVLGRLGGDEFAVILPGADEAAAQRAAASLLEALATVPVWPTISASIGLTSYGAEPGVTQDALMARADAAMYRAKADGRNRQATYHPGHSVTPAM